MILMGLMVFVPISQMGQPRLRETQMANNPNQLSEKLKLKAATVGPSESPSRSGEIGGVFRAPLCPLVPLPHPGPSPRAPACRRVVCPTVLGTAGDTLFF